MTSMMLTGRQREILLGADADVVGDAIYLHDGKRLVEVRTVDSRGRIVVHNCANAREDAVFHIVPTQMKSWTVVRPEVTDGA